MRFFRITVLIGIPIIAISIVSLFFIPPLTESASPLVCASGAKLRVEPSPVYARNVIFTCIHADGTRTDATTPVFMNLCLYVIMPYGLLLMVLWVIGKVSRIVPMKST